MSAELPACRKLKERTAPGTRVEAMRQLGIPLSSDSFSFLIISVLSRKSETPIVHRKKMINSRIPMIFKSPGAFLRASLFRIRSLIRATA